MSDKPHRTKYLGEILVKEHGIDPRIIKDTLECQKALAKAGEAEQNASGDGKKRRILQVGDILLDEHHITVDQLYDALSKKHGMPYHSGELELDDANYTKLREQERRMCFRGYFAPIKPNGFAEDGSEECIHVALAKPDDRETLGEARQLFGGNVRFYLCAPTAIMRVLPYDIKTEIHQFINNSLALIDDDSKQGRQKEEIARDDDAAVKIVEHLIIYAVRNNASDIHFEPFQHRARIRLRIDGRMIDMATMPKEILSSIAGNIQVAAGIDNASRSCLDGKLKKEVDGRTIDCRVSVLPSVSGDAIVIRVQQPVLIEIDDLGYRGEDLRRVKSFLNKSAGMIVVTGPTGSGKTVTLYSCLVELRRLGGKIVTIEDPPEIEMGGVTQLKVSKNVNYATAIKAFLRADPNIILIGEIRDVETAEYAFQAAMTGHLVLTTLHCRDSVEAIQRLEKLGVQRDILASNLLCVSAQKLVAKVCHECGTLVDRPDLAAMAVFEGKKTFMKANDKGCDKCRKGYSGRRAVCEVFANSGAITEAINEGASMTRLRDMAKNPGDKSSPMIQMHQNGLDLVKNDITTWEELCRNAPESAYIG